MEKEKDYHIVFSLVLKHRMPEFMEKKGKIGSGGYSYGDALDELKEEKFMGVGADFARYVRRCESGEKLLKWIAEGMECLLPAVAKGEIGVEMAEGGEVRVELRKIEKIGGYMILRFFEK